MAVNEQALFAFSRTLPEPFDTVKPKLPTVHSKYSDKTGATLSTPLIKAVHAYMACRDGSGPGAVGRLGTKTITEYKSAMSPDAYHLVVYDTTNGMVCATVYDLNTEIVEQYTMSNSGRDGSAVHLALMPVYLTDDEFSDAFEEYMTDRSSGYPDMTAASEHMALMCDNAYRRIKDETCAAHIKLGIDKSGNLTRITKGQIDASKYVPDEVIAGEFRIFAQTGPARIIKPSVAIDLDDFVGKYPLRESRVLSTMEQQLVPKLPGWYILPREVISVCKHAARTTGKATPMRNFLLRGPAGTGKTMGAQAIAAGLNIPYVKFTCSANTEIYDFVGQVFPDTAAPSTRNAQLDAEREELMRMGGMTYENVAKLMQLPGLDDMDYDAPGVYESLTGMTKPAATSQECMAVVMERVAEKIRLLSQVEKSDQGQTYTYVETDLIRALKYGYCVEIQEPTVIMQPGVLVGLNSLLEQTGSITLPTGEVIQRHPDAVVVITTNVSYEGCRGLNQSVVDRMSLVQDIDLPGEDVMAKRAMSVTGCEDETMVAQMVRVVNDMSDFMRKNNITDGNCGMRSLIDWIISTEITGDAYTSALFTVISKATSDEDDREALIDSVLKPVFAPPRRRKTA